MQVFVYRTTDIDRVVRELSARGLVFTPEKHGLGPEHFSAPWRDALIEVYPSAGERECDRCAGVAPTRPLTVCRECLDDVLT
jgi:hypothetical protein